MEQIHNPWMDLITLFTNQLICISLVDVIEDKASRCVSHVCLPGLVCQLRPPINIFLQQNIMS